MQCAKEFVMYRYSGDRYNYQDNFKNAIELTGDNSEEVYLEYQESGMRRFIEEKDFVFSIVIDSTVMVDQYDGIVFSRQIIRRKNLDDLIRNIFISFTARDVTRNKLNKLGVVLDGIDLFNNTRLK